MEEEHKRVYDVREWLERASRLLNRLPPCPECGQSGCLPWAEKYFSFLENIVKARSYMTMLYWLVENAPGQQISFDAEDLDEARNHQTETQMQIFTNDDKTLYTLSVVIGEDENEMEWPRLLS
jgi:hypothetical protein